MIKIAICDEEENDRNEIYRVIQEYTSRCNKGEYCIRLFMSGAHLLASDFLSDVLLFENVVKGKEGIHFGAAIRQQKVNAIVILYEGVTQLGEILKFGEVTFLSENNTIIKLSARDIYYFEYCNRKIKIVTKDKMYICVKTKIGDIAIKMKKYGFAMSHQSFVVNLYHVDKIVEQSLIMENGDVVYLAQKRASAIRRQLMQMVN